jgi:hypothetical protein
MRASMPGLDTCQHELCHDIPILYLGVPWLMNRRLVVMQPSAAARTDHREESNSVVQCTLENSVRARCLTIPLSLLHFICT